MYAAHVVVVVMVVAVAAHHVSSTPDSCRTSTINRGRTAGSSSVGSRACGHGRALKAASRQPAHPEQAACGTAARGGCVLLAGYCCVSRIQGVHTCGLHCSSMRLMVVTLHGSFLQNVLLAALAGVPGAAIFFVLLLEFARIFLLIFAIPFRDAFLHRVKLVLFSIGAFQLALLFGMLSGNVPRHADSANRARARLSRRCALHDLHRARRHRWIPRVSRGPKHVLAVRAAATLR